VTLFDFYKKLETDTAKEVLNLLKGKSINPATPGFAAYIVKLYQSIILFWRTEEDYPEMDDITKYIHVKFDAWVYNGSDQLWTSILIEIWKAIGETYGHNKLRFYRASVELERSKQKDTNATTDTTNSKSLYQTRVESIQSFKMESFLSALCAAVVPGITTYLKLNSDIDLGLYWVLILIGLGLVPISRQLYILFRYVLPKPWVLQIGDKASLKRHDLLNDTGYKGLVKNEFEYILDFLRYTPYVDKENKCKRRAHLCIFVDDLDRCEGNTVMSVLEAVILLLVDAPVTCWLALDTRLVVAAIEDAKKGILDVAGVSGYDYMEKIIELPFCIPDLDYEKKKTFVSRLFLQGQLDPVHLLKKIQSINGTIPGQVLDNTKRFPVYTATTDKKNDEATAAQGLVKGMEGVVNSQEQIGFDSLLVKDPIELVKRIHKEIAIDSQKWHSMDTKHQEDFLFLVCEWIEWVQDGSKAKEERKMNQVTAEVEELMTTTVEDNKESMRSKEEEKQEITNNQENSSPAQDVENPRTTTKIVNKANAPFETMVTKKEKKWFIEQYVKYMSGKARTITRVVNNYVVARFVAVELNPKAEDVFRKKLIKIIILAEQWPYRLSWLMQIAEDAWQESLLKQKHHEVKNCEQDVIGDLQHVGLNIVDTGITDNGNHADMKNSDDDKEEEWTTFSQKSLDVEDAVDDKKYQICATSLETITAETPIGSLQHLENKKYLAFDEFDKEVNKEKIDAIGKKIEELEKQINNIKKVQNILSEATQQCKYWKEAGIIKRMVKWKKVVIDANDVLEGSSPLPPNEMNKNEESVREYVSLAIEKDMYKCLENLSLLDVYQQMVKSLLHSPGENAAKLLSRDGDPQVFEQLLAEDNSDLKLIDLALPFEFKNQELNGKFETLRPFMINMSRHMIERTSEYMERCVIHKNDEYKEQGGGPKLLFQSTKSYYEKGEKK
jgi:hypothetical protein